jgi:hypothetical protein
MEPSPQQALFVLATVAVLSVCASAVAVVWIRAWERVTTTAMSNGYMQESARGTCGYVWTKKINWVKPGE